LALGSDSGGSIRLPAAWCGVAGLKPTFGRVPLTGHFPECGSLEDGRTVIGPLARKVADLAAALTIVAGPDGLDAGIAPVPLGNPNTVDLGALRVGIVRDRAVELAVSGLATAGASLVDLPVDHVRDEALEITRRYWNRAQLTGRDNLQLLRDWDDFRQRLLVATAHVDVVVTPATETTAPSWRRETDTDYRWMLPWSLIGNPVVVLPVDMQANLPTSVQVIGQPWKDHVALAAAACIEASVPGVPEPRSTRSDDLTRDAPAAAEAIATFRADA
jgi:amidase